MPIPLISFISIPILWTSFFDKFAISVTISSVGRSDKVGTESFTTIFPSSVTIPAAIFVPPRSIPI